MKHAVQVTILGHQYTVKSEAPPEKVLEVAAFANEKISEVVAANKAIDTLDTALLALLNVSGAYIQLCEERQGQEGQIEEHLQKLLRRLERACSERGVP